MTKPAVLAAATLCALALSACHKKPPAEVPAPAPAPTAQAPAPTPAPAPSPVPAPSAEPTDEQRETARKQAKLDYATMEDQYINDPHAQWATTAKASSTFGDDGGKKQPSDVNAAANVTGPLDDRTWTNNHQDVGFDTLELGFSKPVNATELRVVCEDSQAVATISKVEVQDEAGVWSTVWSGLSDTKKDERGSRTWFVRKFDKTAAKVKGARVTFANNVESGYKVVNAVQLVGD